MANITNKNRDLILSGNLTKAILTLAIPIAINNLIQTMYNLTDAYWLGTLSTEYMSAISLVTPIQNIIINFGQGLNVAGSVLISQYIGAGDEKNAKSMSTQIFISVIVFSILCAISFIIASPFIISWLGATEYVYTYSLVYLRIILCDMPFLFIINIYSAINQANGNTVKPMYLNLLGILLNMILDPLFLIVFKWGIAGAGFATMLSKVPCSLIAFYSLVKNSHIRFKGFRFEREKLAKIIKIGLPSALGGSTMQFGFLLMSKNVLEYGSVALAAYGVGNRINSIITMPSNSMGSAVATIVGQNIGAGQKERAEKSYLRARTIAVVFLFISGMILSRDFISYPIAEFFTKTDPNTTLLAADFLAVMAFWCWANGIDNSTSALFQGTGHTMINMVIDASRLWIFRFLTLYICANVFDMGVRSVWYSVVVSNGISALIRYILYKMRVWEKDILNIAK
ncbi:MAG: MATE family efflux transporter [Firmicutes bacterium]|nr:MATE family efflux transporter [Bacillota bacterium]